MRAGRVVHTFGQPAKFYGMTSIYLTSPDGRLKWWTMDPDVREFLVDDYGEDALPFVTRFGDGGPVGRDVVDTVNAVYAATSRSTPWQAGDLLVVDNVAAAHGREAFTGPRELLVALGVPTILEGAR